MNEQGQTVTLRRRKKKKTRPVAAILLALGILIVGVGAFFAVWLHGSTKPPEIEPSPSGNTGGSGEEVPVQSQSAGRQDGVYSFLVVGLDNPTNSRNTDVLMLCNFDTNTGDVNILQIPRDTYVDDALMSGEGKRLSGASTYCKINNLFNLAYADHQNSHPDATKDEHYKYAMDYLCDKISSMLCVPIDFHISFNTVMYRDLLEIVCPITLDVPFDMDYDDPTQDLHIHLKKGVQELNAEQAEGFSRFRQNNNGSSLLEGDFSRVDLQKMVLAAIAEKFFTTISLPSAHQFVGSVLNNIETNLTLENCVWFVQKALTLYTSQQMTLDSIRMYDLPCVVPSMSRLSAMGYKLSYGFMEKNLGYTLTILNRAFCLSQEPITAEMLGYEEPFEITYCDHSDTEGKSLQEILTSPPKVSMS